MILKKNKIPQSLSKEWLGSLAIFSSAFCFYLSTVSIRWSQENTSLEPAFFVFARFFLGFCVLLGVLLIQQKIPKPRHSLSLFARMITNVIAVFFFFKGVHTTTVAEANILNMTYPLFIALISWGFLKNQIDWPTTLAAGVAFLGIVCVLFPEELSFDLNHLWALGSAALAAVSLICLNITRQYHDTETVLFFMFGLGSLAIYFAFQNDIYWPNSLELQYLGLCAGMGVIGQYLLTLGFRYVSPIEGGIISSTRILMAALLGSYLVGDPALTLFGWLGALLILGSNVYLAYRRMV